jgi:hypothetical protein
MAVWEAAAVDRYGERVGVFLELRSGCYMGNQFDRRFSFITSRPALQAIFASWRTEVA